MRKSYQTKRDVKVQAVRKFVESLLPADHACRSYVNLDLEYVIAMMMMVMRDLVGGQQSTVTGEQMRYD